MCMTSGNFKYHEEKQKLLLKYEYIIKREKYELRKGNLKLTLSYVSMYQINNKQRVCAK